MVYVEGGVFKRWFPWEDQTLQMQPFFVGKFEVTLSKWQSVRDAATALGYDIAGVGSGLGPNHPVESINWYDALKWCNARSELEGLRPVYWVGDAPFRTGQVTPRVDSSAAGYRLPSEAEWEWAARGGRLGKGYEFSGSNNADDVSWFWHNAGGMTRAVGTKRPNELGLYDMSGNVNEWCWDQYSNSESFRFIRGGSADGLPGYGQLFYFGLSQAPDYRSNQTGFRPIRSATAVPTPAPTPSPQPTPSPSPRPGSDLVSPTLKVTSPGTVRGSRYTLAARLTDNVRPVRVRYRLRAPGTTVFGKWVVVGLRNKAPEQNWSQRVVLSKIGVWRIEIQTFDAASNASRLKTIQVSRGR